MGVSLSPYFDAAREAQEKGAGKISDFSNVANEFASMGQENYANSEKMYGSWKKTMDDYYNELNQNEFGAQEQQKMLQQQEANYANVQTSLSSQGINPGSAFALDNFNMSGEEGAMQQGQAQTNSKYEMLNQQNNWNNYGIQQQSQEFGRYQQAVGMQGTQTQSYVNMYSGLAQTSLSLASQQQQLNSATSSSGMGSTIGSVAGGIAGSYFGPAGSMAGSALGGMAGSAIDG